jgi:hypothetical protein
MTAAGKSVPVRLHIYHRRATGHTWDPGHQYFVDAAQATWPGLPPYAEFGAPLAATSA